MRAKIESVLEHISHVQEKTRKMGLKLIDLGDPDLGINLIRKGLAHDRSKLHGIELEFLHPEYVKSKPEEFKLAWRQHVLTNDHHPEYHGGIKFMPPVCLAEMVADWAARSNEKDECLNDFINGPALEKFKFSKECEVYKGIMKYRDLITEKWN